MRVTSLLLLFALPILSYGQIAFYDAQKLAELSSNQIDLVFKFAEENKQLLQDQKDSFNSSIATEEEKKKNLSETKEELDERRRSLENQIDDESRKTNNDERRKRIIRLRRDLNNVFDELRRADADIRASNSRITTAKLSIAELDKRQPLISETSGSGQPSEKEVLENLQKFLANPFDTTVKKLEFDLIYKILERVFKEIDDSSEDRKANSIAGPLLGVLPTAISTFNSKGGPSESDIIKELSLYIADEFRKGVTASYVKVFEKKLDDVGELQLMFPSTYKMLKERDPFTYPDLGKEWKVTIEEDLRKLLPNLIEFIETPDGDLKMKFLTEKRVSQIKNKQSYNYLVLSTDVISKLIDKYHPSDLFAYLDAKYHDSDYKIGKVENVIHGIEIFQSNLRDTTKSKESQFSNIWISPEQFKLLNTDRELELFAGLIYQQDRAFFKPMKDAIFDGSTFKIKKFRTFHKKKILPVLDALNKIKEYESALQSKEDYKVYLELFIDLFKVINSNFTIDSKLEEINKAALLIKNHKEILKGKFDDIVEKVDDKEFVEALLVFADSEELREKAKLFEERMTDSALVAFLSLKENTKLAQTEIDRLTGTLEEKIKQLSLPENCKLSIDEIELIKNPQSFATIKAELLKYKELIKLSEAEELLMTYKKDAKEILELFEDNRLSSTEWGAILAKIDKRVDDEWIESLNHVLHIYQAIKEKNNENLLTHLMQLLDVLIEDQMKLELNKLIATVKDQEKRIANVKKAIKQAQNGSERTRLSAQLAILNNKLGELENDEKFQQEGYKKFQNAINLIRKYLPFLIALSDADDQEDLRKVIRQYVAPADSYAKKRVSPRFVTINSHPGFFVGQEKLKVSGKTAANVGATAPIGLEIGTRIIRKKYANGGSSKIIVNSKGTSKYISGHSLSLFVQLVDVGAILNYRIDDNNAEELTSDFSFKQIWAPGASANFGFRNTPLTLGVGWQRVATLRKILMDQDTTKIGQPSSATRWFIRLSWDIPLVNVWTKNN